MKYITDIAQAQTVLANNDIQLITFDHNVSYDTGLSSMYFDDFISNASGCHEVQLFDGYLVIYGDNVSKDDKYFKRWQLEKMRKADLLDLCDWLAGGYYDMDNTKDDLIHELMSIDNEAYYKAHFAESRYHDLDYDFSFTGYSQGDHYYVKTVGNVEAWLNADYLTNIFYDSPISGNIEININGVTIDDISIYEFIQNEYAYWDKDDFIKQASDYFNDKDYKDLLLEYLENNLSNSLNYY